MKQPSLFYDSHSPAKFTVDCLVKNMDAVDFLRGLPPESVDLVVTDPAYESLEKHRKIGTTTRLKKSAGSSNEWFSIFKNERFPELFKELYRVLKENTHCYVMCDQETMFAIKPMGEEAGFTFWKPIVWDKGSIGMGYHYRARHEFILFFEKGKRNLADLGTPDVLNFKKVSNGYPTEKPVELLEILVKQSCVEDGLVVDPFTGSGSTGVAAKLNGRRFAGSEINEEAANKAIERINAS